jgi:cation/acetate symporter
MNGTANGFTVAVFAVLLALTVWILVRTSRRVKTTSHFWAAGHSISGPQNGVAMSGDFLGAATMLGSVGLIMLFGFDGALYSLGWLVGFVTVLFFAGERLRNAGRYTLGDALTLRLSERPTRCAVAVTTLLISFLLLVTQLLAAGLLLQGLAGIDYPIAVLITTAAFLCYVVFGGMFSVTWLQILKAGILASITAVVAVWVLAKVGFGPSTLLSRAADHSEQGHAFLRPGLFLTNTVDMVSLGIALVFGVAGLPHLLMRFVTVPDKAQARSSVWWSVAVIGFVYALTIVIGLGARALLTPAEVKAAGDGGNLAAPVLVQKLGGGAGTWGGDLFLAVFVAAAFATALALVAGLVIAASSAVSHDIFASVIRRGQVSDREEVRMARLTTVGIAVFGVLLALYVKDKNIVFLAGLVYALAASTNFPVLTLALGWRRFSTTGAVLGVALGTVSSLVLIVLSPGVWPGDNPPIGLTNPAIISVPLGFFGCWLGSVLRPDPTAERLFPRLSIRATTGLGAERSTPPTPV